jgi:hypothetical protein
MSKIKKIVGWLLYGATMVIGSSGVIYICIPRRTNHRHQHHLPRVQPVRDSHRLAALDRAVGFLTVLVVGWPLILVSTFVFEPLLGWLADKRVAA